MPSAAQIRAARALLGISARELSKITGVGWATIQRYEAINGIPSGQKSKMELIVAGLERAGIEFIGDPINSPGVRLRDTMDAQPDSRPRD